MSKGRVKVTLIPLGNKIKFFVRGSRIFCDRMKKEIKRSGTYQNTDSIFINILGSERAVRQFVHENKPKTVLTTLTDLGYDHCDSSGKRVRKLN